MRAICQMTHRPTTWPCSAPTCPLFGDCIVEYQRMESIHQHVSKAIHDFLVKTGEKPAAILADPKTFCEMVRDEEAAYRTPDGEWRWGLLSIPLGESIVVKDGMFSMVFLLLHLIAGIISEDLPLSGGFLISVLESRPDGVEAAQGKSHSSCTLSGRAADHQRHIRPAIIDRIGEMLRSLVFTRAHGQSLSSLKCHRPRSLRSKAGFMLSRKSQISRNISRYFISIALFP